VQGDRVVQVDRKTNTIRDAAGVRAKFGVEPALIPDFLALVGDAADGYPGIAGIGAVAAFGWASLDAVAGLAVAVILLWGAVTVFRESSYQLMDHELPEDARARIAALMTEDPRISDVHQLRTRASGPIVHIQMHADLDPQLSLIAAHQAVVAAEKRVLAAFPAADIIIHPDPRGRAEPHGGAFAEFHEATDDSR